MHIEEIRPLLNIFLLSYRLSIKFHERCTHSMIGMYAPGHQMFTFAIKLQ